jgi:hypothetical protein
MYSQFWVGAKGFTIEQKLIYYTIQHLANCEWCKFKGLMKIMGLSIFNTKLDLEMLNPKHWKCWIHAWKEHRVISRWVGKLRNRLASVPHNIYNAWMWVLKIIPIKYHSAYMLTRHYGGAEEGGWWYNNYHLIETKPSFMIGRIELERKHFDKNWGNIYSVLGGGKVCVYVEEEPGENETKVAPHYE